MRIIRRWQDHVAISLALLSLLKFTLLTCILAHWLACLWGFVASSSDATWTGYDDGLSWRQKAQLHSANVYELYGVALYVALNNIFGGSCEIQAGNYREFFVQSFMLIIGSSVWAYVIGSACGIVATLDPSGIEHRQMMDEVNGFCKEQCVPNELTVRLRSYFRELSHIVRARRHEALLTQMSTRLRGEAAIHMCAFRLHAVPFLIHDELEPEFMCDLAIRSSTRAHSRLERVPCVDLFVIERGVAAKRGCLGLVGACFGKDVILSNENLRDTSDAIALTFLQVTALGQADIFDLLTDYPRAYHIIRKAALRLALTRALVKVPRPRSCLLAHRPRPPPSPVALA